MAKKETQIETVTRTLTVTLPKQFDDYLESLAKAVGRPVESLMLEDLYSILENFFSSSYAEAWAEHIVGIDNKHGKELEAQVKQVADKLFDC